MYLSFEERQKFGMGQVIVRHPEIPIPGSSYKKRHTEFPTGCSVDDILDEFPELGFMAVDIESLSVGAEVECEIDLQAGDSPEWLNGMWSVEHNGTLFTSLGIPRLKESRLRMSADNLTHREFVMALFMMGQDPTNNTFLVNVKEASNSYGDFIFLDFYDRWAHHGISLYGYGYHYHFEKWKYDWTFNPYQKWGERLERDKRNANRRYHNQQIEYLFELTGGFKQPKVKTDTPKSPYASAYSLIADLTDEDAAITELEDNPYLLDFLNDEENF